MLDELVAFLLSLGIVGTLIAWGFACGVWHRQDQQDESSSSSQSFRESSAHLAKWWKE